MPRPRRTKNNSVLTVCYSQRDSYSLKGISRELCPDFTKLAFLVSDYLEIDGIEDNLTYRLVVTREARREMGEDGVRALENMVGPYNRAVKAKRALEGKLWAREI